MKIVMLQRDTLVLMLRLCLQQPSGNMDDSGFFSIQVSFKTIKLFFCTIKTTLLCLCKPIGYRISCSEQHSCDLSSAGHQ